MCLDIHAQFRGDLKGVLVPPPLSYASAKLINE